MKRPAWVMILPACAAIAHGSETRFQKVIVAGKTYSVPMEGNEPLLVETPEIKMERFEVIGGRSSNPEHRDIFWVINFQVRLKGKWNFEIFSPAAPRYVMKFQTSEPRYFSFKGFPYSECPDLWEPVLDDAGTTFTPFTIRMTPAEGGQTLEFVQWGAGGPDIKARVQKAVRDIFGSRRFPKTDPSASHQ